MILAGLDDGADASVVVVGAVEVGVDVGVGALDACWSFVAIVNSSSSWSDLHEEVLADAVRGSENLPYVAGAGINKPSKLQMQSMKPLPLP